MPKTCEQCDLFDEVEQPHRHEVLAVRDGAAVRTDDELNLVLLEDVASLVSDYHVPAWADRIERGITGWCISDEDSVRLYEEACHAESLLGEVGCRIDWNDGYVIDRIVLEE